MANLLSAHRDLGDGADRDWVARFWGVERIAAQPGRTAVELFDALERGEVKAVWIACTNPAQSMPQQAHIRAALGRAQFVVVQEAYATTETVACADLLLPAATWGEKEGTATNSERGISRVRAAVDAPGAARADWRIACDFALRLGPLLGRDARALFPYMQPDEIFREHARTTQGRDLDIAELDYAILDRDGPQQWPYRNGCGTRRLYADGVFPTPSGRARFIPIDMRTVAESIDAHFPLRMTTGRLRDQWHGMSRTGRCARLFGHAPQPLLEMHPDDMARRGMRDGDIARIRSRRGAILLPVAASEQMRPGQVFVPMHFGARHLSHAGVNELTLSAFDPHSKQPELKHSAVQIDPARLGHELVALRCDPDGDPEQALRWLDCVQPLLARYAYAYAGLCGREWPAAYLRIEHDAVLTDAQLDAIDAALGLPASGCLSYRDPRRGIDKRALISAGRLQGFRLSGNLSAVGWLSGVLTEAQPADTLRRWMLGPFASDPSRDALPERGRIVCTCVGVAQSEIEARIAAGACLESLQAGLRCGTTCGSCLPELRRMLADANGDSERSPALTMP